MTTTDALRKVQFILDADSDEGLNQVAAQMSRDLGVPVSRSEIVRRAVRQYLQSTRSIERTPTADRDAA